MLNNIRNFSKTFLAKILLVIIIIPFIFWGMGGVFTGGNTNNIAKINNETISTQDFIDYLNNSNLDSDIIKKNIDNNILEEILSQMISKTLLDMEVKELNINVSEKSLVLQIKNNKNFFDKNNKFSRIKYEKFLLTQNMSAPEFERNLKENELRKKLFSYVSGGIKSPLFMINNLHQKLNSQLEIDFINIDHNYKKKENFTIEDVKKFINENKESLKKDFVNFTYLKITPEILTGNNEYNEFFFKKIDEIENKISAGHNFEALLQELKIQPINKINYTDTNNGNEIENKIYQKRNDNKIQLIDEGEFYVLYKINKIQKKLLSLDDKNYLNKIYKILFEKNKYEYNQKLLSKINENKFSRAEFDKLSNTTIKKIKLISIKDDNKFKNDSVKHLYNLPINSFTLIVDKEDKIYLAQTKKLYLVNIKRSSKDFKNYNNQTNMQIRDKMYSSYDYFLNEKYKITINEKTLDRVKNYFR